ncbi:PilZ domain-containing protein [Thiomicrorhabdus cannonii]|uniref:PilZ domain-containing protein n=1 Tax=Thiomicrorhabdus cannonii TaxID=2748011 RepID=UPI0015B8FAA0|nr:PilZ domain-containing protein [Thiomicrorhabdus cannonii]
MKNDQRSFFRIDVMLPCSYRIVPQDAVEQTPLPGSPDSKYIEEYFMQNLADLDTQINEVIAQINVKSSLLAAALTAMNSKINFMMQTIDANQLSRAIPQRLVNLSGGGISFTINETINPTDKVDLLFKPLEDESPVLVRCDLVNITPIVDEENTYRVSLSYTNLSEEDRRKVLFFIQSKEIEYAQIERKKSQDID